MRAMTFETPDSSNVVRVHIGVDEDVVLVEYAQASYSYEADGVTREALRSRLEAGESAGRVVIALLHPLPYRKVTR